MTQLINKDQLQFQRDQATRFLELLGKDPAATWLRAIDPQRKRGGGAEQRGVVTDDEQGWINRKTTDGFNLFFITGNAETIRASNAKDADITSCPAFFVEWDDGADIETQVQRWQALGLPEPTVMVSTSGKSVHCYWVLHDPLEPVQWRAITVRLIAHCNSDKTCCNPSRLMRLPGSVYFDKKTGKATGNCRIIDATGARYSAAEIEEALPTPAPLKPLTAAPKGQYPPRCIDEINDAAYYIPQRTPGQGNYERDRNAICGCSAALAAAGVADPDVAALALMGHLWPSEVEARQVLDSTTTRKAASFWAIALEGGYQLKRTTTTGTGVEPASFQALIQTLDEGWKEDKGSQLSAGKLAAMLPARSLRFNEMSLRAEVFTSSGWVQIADSDIDSAYVLLTGMGWKIGVDPVLKAVLHVARQTPVHPLREYLQSIEASHNIEHFDLDKVASTFFRTESKLHAAMVRKWLIGAVNRAFVPGCQMDYVLVLQGEQGLLKSNAFRALASPDWHCSTAPQEEKDFLLNVHSCWIFELGELESITRGKASGRLKNLITTSIDSMRPPYGRTTERMPRSSVFGGTCNEDNFLVDATGNRRYWVLPITGSEKIDVGALAAARNGIWKSAMAAYRTGELPMLSDADEARSSDQNQQYNQHDPWIDIVAAWMERDTSTRTANPDDQFTSAEVLFDAGLRPTGAITRADEMRVSSVLKELGFRKDKNPEQVRGVRCRRWRLAAQPAQPALDEVVHPITPTGASDPPTTAQTAQPKKIKEHKTHTPTTSPTCVDGVRTGGCAPPQDTAKTPELHWISGCTTSSARGCAHVVHSPPTDPLLTSQKKIGPEDLEKRKQEASEYWC